MPHTTTPLGPCGRRPPSLPPCQTFVIPQSSYNLSWQPPEHSGHGQTKPHASCQPIHGAGSALCWRRAETTADWAACRPWIYAPPGFEEPSKVVGDQFNLRSKDNTKYSLILIDFLCIRVDYQRNVYPLSAQQLRWEDDLWPLPISFKTLKTPDKLMNSIWWYLNPVTVWKKNWNWTLFLTGNVQPFSFGQDPKQATLNAPFHGHNTGGPVPIAAWIIGACFILNIELMKRFLSAINNHHFCSDDLSTVGATAASTWWSPTRLATTSYTRSLCLSAFVRIIRARASSVGDWGPAEVFDGALEAPQQNEGSLTSLLFNSLQINPVRRGARMNNVTAGCTLTTIISLHAAWTLTIQF